MLFKMKNEIVCNWKYMYSWVSKILLLKTLSQYLVVVMYAAGLVIKFPFSMFD